jgi:very-short-patch-repair endonuclease
VDFCAPAKKLAIEVDGSLHLDQAEYDEERIRYLEGLGYQVIRFWNHEVMQDIQSVLLVIEGKLKEMGKRSPTLPSPNSENLGRARKEEG